MFEHKKGAFLNFEKTWNWPVENIVVNDNRLMTQKERQHLQRTDAKRIVTNEWYIKKEDVGLKETINTTHHNARGKRTSESH